jgi:V/A-type H+-transporting ATPase subunit C
MKIKENSLFEAESYIDKAMFKHLLTLKNDFWQGYVRNWIDFVNLRTILRCKFFDMSRDMFENMIIDGGYVDKGRLLRAFSENYENISKHFRISDLSKVFDRLMESYIKDKDFSKLEREIDNALMEYLKKSKLYALSLENLIAYVVAYESELKNVKFIIEGKRNNVSEEAIKERLRETYV